VFFKRGPRAFRRILPARTRCGGAHNRLPILTLLSFASVQSTARIAMHAQSGLASVPILNPAILLRSNSHASAMALACELRRRGKRVPSSSQREGSRELAAKSPLCRTVCRPAAFSLRIRAQHSYASHFDSLMRIIYHIQPFYIIFYIIVGESLPTSRIERVLIHARTLSVVSSLRHPQGPDIGRSMAEG
jgi:hypothetical protein